MPKACPQCSRVNPPEALFCYLDGVALGHRAGHLDPGSQSFAFPFVFPSGQQCRNFDQLALVCHQNWTDAVSFLRQGDLGNFLGSVGRADLAQAARAAARQANPDQGLDQLLTQLPTRALEPGQLHVEPARINLGKLSLGQDARFELHLFNQGMRLLRGNVRCEDCVWLALGEAPGAPQKLFEFRNDTVIPVHVRGRLLRAHSKPLEAHLVIESSGGNITVPVVVEVSVKPYPDGVLAGAVTPRKLAEKAKRNPREAAPLFEHGAVARWYESNGWTYPIQGPASSGLGAIQQFFEALGLVTPPRVEVREKSITLQGRPGDCLEHVLEVVAEKRPVYAYAVSNAPWLEVRQVRMAGPVAKVRLVVPAVPACPGQVLVGSVTVQANGKQRFVLPVSLAVSGRPSGIEAGPILNVLDVVVPGYQPEPLPLALVDVAIDEPLPLAQVLSDSVPELLPIVQKGASMSAHSPFDYQEEPVLRIRRKRRSRSIAPWLVASAVILMVMAAVLWGIRQHAAAAPYQEAEVAAAHVLETAYDPSSVEFVSWYPPLPGSGPPFGRRVTPIQDFRRKERQLSDIDKSTLAIVVLQEDMQRQKFREPWVLVHAKIRAKNAQGGLILVDNIFYVSKGKVIYQERLNDTVDRLVDPRDVEKSSSPKRWETFALDEVTAYLRDGDRARVESLLGTPDKASKLFEENCWTYEGKVIETTTWKRQTLTIYLKPTGEISSMHGI